MKTKVERITALVASEHSPVRTQAALEAMSEKELDGLEAHVAKKVEEARVAAAPPVPAPVPVPAPAPTAAAAAPATIVVSEDEWLKQAPAYIRDMVSDGKAREASEKTRLVGLLKANQTEYTEAELNAMSAKELTRIARLANIDEPVNYGPNGAQPRSAQGNEDVYRNPPDGYRIALEAQKKAGNKQKETVQ